MWGRRRKGSGFVKAVSRQTSKVEQTLDDSNTVRNSLKSCITNSAPHVRSTHRPPNPTNICFWEEQVVGVGVSLPHKGAAASVEVTGPNELAENI